MATAEPTYTPSEVAAADAELALQHEANCDAVIRAILEGDLRLVDNDVHVCRLCGTRRAPSANSACRECHKKTQKANVKEGLAE